MFKSQNRESCLENESAQPVSSRLTAVSTHNPTWHTLATGVTISPCLPLVQTQPEVGAADDEYEREADAVADQIVRMPEPILGSVPARSTQARGEEDGQPLSESARNYFEPRFGQSFSQVRVHAGSDAAGIAHGLNASAFTYGHNIAFGKGQFAPDTAQGRRLIAHELTHVLQQTGGAGGLVRRRSGVRLARTPLNLSRLDRDLTGGGVLTQTHGEIGFGATEGGRMATPTEDRALPISAQLYQHTPLSSPTTTPGRTTPGTGPVDRPHTTPRAEEPDAGPPQPDAGVPTERQPRDAGTSLPGGVPEAEPVPMPTSPAPSARRAERAVVVSGIHGNERGPLDIVAQLERELGAGTNPLRRDFDTLVIPAMNPGGIADNTRPNRRGVDLNRNFPGLSGMPAPAGPVPPEQPETRAVRRAIEILHPARVLAMHAIGDQDEGGVYADPIEGVARELACRMAIRMQGTLTGTSGRSGEINVRGNRIAQGVCESRYPGAPPSVTSGQSSLGAWAAAPTAIGGRGTPVITHEVAGKSALPAAGPGRSIATIMPGIREFLLDNARAPSEADDLLRRAINRAFLAGRGGRDEAQLRSTIEGIVRR